MELDRYDRAILKLLQDDARITNTSLAEKVSLSESACLRRVKALEEVGGDRELHRRAEPAEGGLSGERLREHHPRPAGPAEAWKRSRRRFARSPRSWSAI